MPLYLKKAVLSQATIGIWKIEESKTYFEDKYPVSPNEAEWINELSSKKQREWFASRYLLSLINGNPNSMECLKDKYGKPYLVDSNLFISLSHSKSFVAVITSDQKVGIDIQNIVSKIERISSKFITDNEMDFIRYKDKIEKMHVIWGAKECMFKAYGKGQVDFKKHLKVDAFDYNANGFEFDCYLNKPDAKMTFKAYAEKIENYILVYTNEN